MLFVRSNLTEENAGGKSLSLGITPDFRTVADLPSPFKDIGGSLISLNTTSQTKFYYLDFENPFHPYPITGQRESILTSFVSSFTSDKFDLSTVSGFWILCNG